MGQGGGEVLILAAKPGIKLIGSFPCPDGAFPPLDCLLLSQFRLQKTWTITTLHFVSQLLPWKHSFWPCPLRPWLLAPKSPEEPHSQSEFGRLHCIFGVLTRFLRPGTLHSLLPPLLSSSLSLHSCSLSPLCLLYLIRTWNTDCLPRPQGQSGLSYPGILLLYRNSS